MVFNFKFTQISVVLSVLAILVVASPPSARADAVYFSRSQVLKSFFPNSAKVSFETFTPSSRERAILQRRLGYALARQSYYIFVASSTNSSGATNVDGYAIIDEESGQHRPITFAVKLSPTGVVLREEVMVYRESRGDEVRSPRFGRQFLGKTVKDSVRVNSDIDSISGATISSRAIATGVRRALVLFDVAIAAHRRSPSPS